VYLALSYCPHTLHTVIEQNMNNVINFDFRKRKAQPYPELDADIMRILHELVAGVASLHSLNVGMRFFSDFFHTTIILLCLSCLIPALSPRRPVFVLSFPTFLIFGYVF
jgi:hypothetical protein